jgi:hypothetical protein
MKAKKIIAIGLVAAMTLGMSTSVFATQQNPYATVDPKDAPQFSGWDNYYLPTDNVFHVNGQGWLESGVGINETVTNVIVPTMPNLTLKYGDPGLYDFGFDPQRLVDRTGAKKYKDKMNFTKQAKESGVYFLNGPRSSEEDEDEEWDETLNTFDNKSIKLVGTNIGTEPVAFTVSATLAGGQNFEYLEKDPSSAPVVIKANELYQSLYNTIGATWEAYVKAEPYNYETANMLVLAKDIANPNCPYKIGNINFTSEQQQAIDDALAIKFAAGTSTATLWELLAEVASGATEVDGLLDTLSEYAGEANTVVPSDKVGMFLGLYVASGNEGTTSEAYEDVAKETAFKAANANEEAGEGAQKIDVAANYTQVVKGTPGNYKMVYDEGMKDYRKVIISNKDELYTPFQTVAFWFRGVATNNASVAKDVKIPALDFTWSFSKKIPEPVVELPKLLKVNGTPIAEIPGFNGVFTKNDCTQDGNIVLTFDHKVYGVDYATSYKGEQTDWIPLTNDQLFAIEEEEVILKANYWIDAVNSDRYLRVAFTEGYNVPEYLGYYTLKKTSD